MTLHSYVEGFSGFHESHDGPCPAEPRRTIHDITSHPRVGDEIRMLGGLVRYRVEEMGHGEPMLVYREETTPRGGEGTMTLLVIGQHVWWSDLCRAACSWEPGP